MVEGTQSLHFSNPIYIKTIRKVLQGGISSVLMIGSVLVLIQVLSERGAFGGVKGGVLSYCPI